MANFDGNTTLTSNDTLIFVTEDNTRIKFPDNPQEGQYYEILQVNTIKSERVQYYLKSNEHYVRYAHNATKQPNKWHKINLNDWKNTFVFTRHLGYEGVNGVWVRIAT